jgi:hypothetical protein
VWNVLSLRKTKTKTASKDMQIKAKSNNIQQIAYNFLFVYFSDKPEFKLRAGYFRAKPVKFKGRVAILISATTDQTVSN